MSPERRIVLVLATAQALFQSTSVLVVTIGGLAGSQVSSPALATAPLGAMSAGSTSDMASSPDTAAPAMAGHAQSHGPAAGATSKPITPTVPSTAATKIGGRRRPRRSDQLGKNRIAGKVATLNTAKSAAVDTASNPAS